MTVTFVTPLGVHSILFVSGMHSQHISAILLQTMNATCHKAVYRHHSCEVGNDYITLWQI